MGLIYEGHSLLANSSVSLQDFFFFGAKYVSQDCDWILQNKYFEV